MGTFDPKRGRVLARALVSKPDGAKVRDARVLKTLKMPIVPVQRYRSNAQKNQLKKDQKKWSEEEAGRKINLKSVDWKTYSPWLRLAKDTSTIPDKFTIKECRGTGQLEIALDF